MAKEVLTSKNVQTVNTSSVPKGDNVKDDNDGIPAKRTRLSFSKDKKLAYSLASLVVILSSKPVAAVLTEEQKTKVTKAKELANELGDADPLKPVTDRITAIQSELRAIDYVKDLEKASAQAKELALELDKQIKRKKQIEEMIS